MADRTKTNRDWVALLRTEYLEMPGLNLTKPQIQKLCSVDAARCDGVVAALIAGGFLERTLDDAYVRADIHPERLNPRMARGVNDPCRRTS